jgi:hypothetical protein
MWRLFSDCIIRCPELNDRIVYSWGFAGQLIPEDLGCEGKPGSKHIYFGLQIPRKYHPSFDKFVR